MAARQEGNARNCRRDNSQEASHRCIRHFLDRVLFGASQTRKTILGFRMIPSSKTGWV